MLFVLTQSLAWVGAAFALGLITGALLRLASTRLARKSDIPNMKRYALKSDVPTAATLAASMPAPVITADPARDLEALEKELAARDALIDELRAGLDREVAFRRAAVARLEGLMNEQAALLQKVNQ
jgi:hypothetical protein